MKQCRVSAGKRYFVPGSWGYYLWLTSSALFFGHTLKLESCRSCANVREAKDATCLLGLNPHVLKTVLNITHNICFSTCFSSLVINIEKQP